MGKLRDSLTSAATLTGAVDKTVKAALPKLNALVSDSDAWMKSGTTAVDHLYLYLAEKLKAQGVQMKTVENKTINDYTDKNVTDHLKAITDFKTKSSDYSAKWDALDKQMSGDLKRVEDALNDVNAQLSKKKKKLFQSKKYKDKLALYERALMEILQKAQGISAKLEELRQAAKKPHSPASIGRNLDITASTTLKKLGQALSIKYETLYKEYKGEVVKQNKTSGDIRAAAEFAEHLKVIQEMIGESDQMEKESEQEPV